jgi:Dolichyl-phosphate-mannose-protein mannosyltransferase
VAANGETRPRSGRFATRKNRHRTRDPATRQALEIGSAYDYFLLDQGARATLPTLSPTPSAAAASFVHDNPSGSGLPPNGYLDQRGAERPIPASTQRAPNFQLRSLPQPGWTAAPSHRRTWVSRAVLLGILVVQAVLSLRLQNTAFEDEALYLYAGHLQLDHLQHGSPLPEDFTTYFSGSPVLYPTLAAAVDAAFGLTGARTLSLVFMLGATALLYSLSRLLFNERAALCAAAVFASTPSTVFLGNFATYDAAAIFLVALAGWIVVRTAHASAIPACALAALVIALGVAVKYAALMFLPTVALLAALTTFRHRSWRGSVLRCILLPTFTLAMLASVLALAGYDYVQGVRVTTTARAVGHDNPEDLLVQSLQWGAGLFALALLGAVAYVRKERMGELPWPRRDGNRGWPWRLALGMLLCGTAMLAPAYQMHLHTNVSLHKHIGYGLLFAAPMAGVGMCRIMGTHVRYPHLAIIAWVTLLTLGIVQSRDLYHAWPDSTSMVATLRSQLKPGGRYLVESSPVPRYYLRSETTPEQWTSTYFIDYTDPSGRRLSGEPAYHAAIREAYFDVIVLNWTVTQELDDKLLRQLRTSDRYRMLGKLPYHTNYGEGYYQIWVKGQAT